MLDSNKVRHILVRHEQGAGHAAEGYASATGKVGVCMATSGPGATNLVTPIADAYMDSVPIVAITGQVASGAIGTDAFQEADIRGITMPITKHNYLVTDPAKIPQAIAEAFHIASTGRPGPVLVDISKDALQATTTFSWPPPIDLPGYRPVTRPHGKQIREATRLIAAAPPPRAVRRWRGRPRRRQRAAASARRADADPRRHDAHGPGHRARQPPAQPRDARHARHGGRGDGPAAVRPPHRPRRPLRRPGHRSALDVRAGREDHPRRHRPRRDLARTAPPTCRSSATSAEVITDLIAQVTLDRATADEDAGWDYAAWREQRRRTGRRPSRSATPTARTARCRRSTSSSGSAPSSGPEATYVAGVGQHQMWAAQFVQYERPNAWINSGGLGTMGFSVPAAMGAKVAEPERTVWAIDGDGCFQMTNQELATCVINNIPIKVAIINNSSLGMVRQWQTLFYNQRYSNTDLQPTSQRVPDFVKLADAYGCLGLRAETPEEVDAAIKQALETNDARRHRLHRPPRRDGVADGAGRCQQRQDPGRASRRAGLGPGGLSDEQAHPVGARRGQARRPGPRRRAVLAPRLQHQLARRRSDRAPGDLADHRRRRRRRARRSSR